MGRKLYSSSFRFNRVCVSCGATRSNSIKKIIRCGLLRCYENWCNVYDANGHIAGHICKTCWNRIFYVNGNKERRATEMLEGMVVLRNNPGRRPIGYQPLKKGRRDRRRLVQYRCTGCKYRGKDRILPSCYIAREHKAITGHEVIREFYEKIFVYDGVGKLLEVIDCREQPQIGSVMSAAIRVPIAS